MSDDIKELNDDLNFREVIFERAGDDTAPTEVEQSLGEDVSEVHWDIGRLRDKIMEWEEMKKEPSKRHQMRMYELGEFEEEDEDEYINGFLYNDFWKFWQITLDRKDTYIVEDYFLGTVRHWYIILNKVFDAEDDEEVCINIEDVLKLRATLESMRNYFSTNFSYLDFPEIVY